MPATYAGLLSRPRALLSLLAVSALALLPAVAQAHFMLLQPSSAYSQGGTYGDPQKTAPCGPSAANPATPTGAVTTYRAGDMVTLSVRETIFHPGHYRVTIGPDPNTFVTPAVTQVGTDQCGMTTIQNPPVMPVIADGLLKHTTQFGGDQTVTFKLPDGFTCQNCTMQVMEFMSNHGAPCFYYHCATVNITNNADAGTTPPLDLSTSPADMADSPPAPVPTGCACQLGAAPSAALPSGTLLALLAGSGLLLRRRRR